MQQPRIDPGSVQFRIAHFEITDYKAYPEPGIRERWTENYRPFPVSLKRPPTGKEAIAVTCPVCARTITLTVASPAAARTARNLRILAGLAVAAIGVALAGWGWNEAAGTEDQTMMRLFFLCLSAGFFLAASGLVASALDQLAQTVSLDRSEKGHKLFEPE